jgi:hypothetical protein
MFTAQSTNILIVVAALVVVAAEVYGWHLSGARGFLWKAAAFIYLLVVRALLVAELEPFVRYSAQVTAPFYILFAIGAWLTVWKLRSVYRKP